MKLLLIVLFCLPLFAKDKGDKPPGQAKKHHSSVVIEKQTTQTIIIKEQPKTIIVRETQEHRHQHEVIVREERPQHRRHQHEVVVVREEHQEQPKAGFQFFFPLFPPPLPPLLLPPAPPKVHAKIEIESK